MSLIIPNLLVGSVDEAFDQSLLHHFKVSSILNVASELNFKERVDLCYHKIGIDDDSFTSNIQDILPCCLAIMQNEIQKEGGTLLVHCLEGKSRSICVVLAYLVIYTHLDWDDGLSCIKEKRPLIDVFPLYLEQTKSYCESLKRSFISEPNSEYS